MRSKIITILIIAFTSIYTAKSDDSPYQFLRYLSSARSSALAGCFVSMPEDPNAVFYNPATLATVKDKYLSTTFLKHVLDINSGLVTYSQDLEGTARWGANVAYTNYGSFDKTNNDGISTGTFGANNIALSGTYADMLDSNLYWGASAKFVFVNIESNSSMAMAIDAGLFYQIPEKRTNIGLSILHAGYPISNIGSESEDLPLDIRAGINHRLRGLPLLVNFTLHHLADTQDEFFERFKSFSLAGELYLGKYIRARLGYDNQVRQMTGIDSDKKLSGFSAGLGIETTDINFDYAINRYGSSATMHRFSLAFNI